MSSEERRAMIASYGGGDQKPANDAPKQEESNKQAENETNGRNKSQDRSQQNGESAKQE